jgi:hypothetical protein
MARGAGSPLWASPGVGKSRLVAEARDASVDGVTWAEGHALSFTASESFSVARDVLRGLLRVPADAPAAAGAALRDGIERVFPGRLEVVRPYLARLLEIPGDEGDAGLIAVSSNWAGLR